MEKINENIAINLKLLRKNRKLTLEEVSKISGVSKSMLGEIERGGTNPTILVLWKIAEGLKIPLTTLIEEEKSEYVLVKKEAKKLITEDSKFSIFSVYPYDESHKFEVLKIEITPFSELSNKGHLNGVDEYIFVTEGKIKLMLGDSEIKLHQGDSIRFKGEISHKFINNSAKTAYLMNLLFYR